MAPDSVWWDDTHINDNQRRAVQDALFSYVVGVFSSGGTAPATGTLVSWKGRLFIMTASHVLEGTQLGNLVFHMRDKGPLVETTPEEAFRKYGPATRVGDKLDVLGIAAASDQYHDDVALLELSSQTNISGDARFYPLVGIPVKVTDGATLLTIGYAQDDSVALAPGFRGLVATGDNALFDSGLNARTDLDRYYDANRHFLIPYSRTDDAIKPHGLSGAGVWCNANPQGNVWTARPILVGVITKWHKRQNLLQITNLESILELFRRLS